MVCVWLIFCIFCCIKQAFGDSLYRNATTITQNVSWYQRLFLPYPALHVSWSISITFPKAVCCPVMKSFTYPPENNTLIINTTATGRCYKSDFTDASFEFDQGNVFILNPKNDPRNKGNCSLQNDMYHCAMNSQTLSYEPKIRWLAFSYLCGQEKSLQGLRFDYRATARNTTQCVRIERTRSSLGCDNFFQFAAFPNVFGMASQNELLKHQLYIQSVLRDHSCHQHLHYVICQASFYQCPNGTTDENNSVSHLTTICPQMCKEVLQACANTQLLVTLAPYANCNYYISTSEQDNCVSLPVTCDLPPGIPNGDIIDGLDFNVTYRLNSTVHYQCHSDFKLTGNKTSTCELSGNWSSPPRCIGQESIRDKYTKGIVAAVAVSAYYVWRRKKEQNRIKNFFENQPKHKRKRTFDSFLCFAGKFEDEIGNEADLNFVINVLLPELEEKADPPLKLHFHERDFRPGELILANIENAVNNSNSAIILMSQAYVDSYWCQREFKVCLLVSAKCILLVESYLQTQWGGGLRPDKTKTSI